MAEPGRPDTQLVHVSTNLPPYFRAVRLWLPPVMIADDVSGRDVVPALLAVRRDEALKLYQKLRPAECETCGCCAVFDRQCANCHPGAVNFLMTIYPEDGTIVVTSPGDP